jgi:outer membrane protein assembly factor BamB
MDIGKINLTFAIQPDSSKMAISPEKYLSFLLCAVVELSSSLACFAQDTIQSSDTIVFPDVEVLSPTFRGNEGRNFYGTGTPSSLDVIWKFHLGEGETVISRRLGSRTWAGAGWTGQPLLVREGLDTFLIQGAYDHKLHKINIANGKEKWSYLFDDVVKGTGTIWENRKAKDVENSLIILQGSRLGVGSYLDSEFIPSLRAISYFTGKELWRLDVRWAGSYSRDVDGSCLLLNDTAYIGLENGIFTVFNPDPDSAALRDKMLQPQIIQELELYTSEDIEAHKKNVVTESSPAKLGNKIFVASGSGHVYGYNLNTRELDWDFYTGSDMDGSVVVTSDNCLLVSVEKQYIKGRGGVFKLDPGMPPDSSVIWYYEVKDTAYESWEGGVIGTVGINDFYINSGSPHLAVVSALDGFTYIIDHQKIDTLKVSLGPDSLSIYPCPVVLAKLETGPSISSPVITADRLLVAGYEGVFLYTYNGEGLFEKLDEFPLMVEASPVLWGGRIYLAGRDGFLYCFGENKNK